MNKALKGYGAYKAYNYMKRSKWAQDASDYALDRVGLARKGSTSTVLTGLGMFALGLVAGGAIGMMFAPMKGSEMRTTMREQGVKGAAEKARAEATHPPQA